MRRVRVWHILLFNLLLIWVLVWLLIYGVWPWVAGILRANGVKGI